MKINPAVVASSLICAFWLAPLATRAQPQAGAAQLARVKTLLELSRAEFTAEELALLSGRLAEAETASVV